MGKTLKWGYSAGGLLYPEEVKFHQGMKERDAICDGALAIYEFPADADGNAIRSKGRLLDIGQNLIVNVGRAAIAALQRGTADGGGAEGTYDLGYLAVGTGSGGGATSPVPGDTGLATEGTDPVGGPVVSGVPRPLCSVTTPPPGPPYISNLWSAQIGSAELNGSAIDEAGIYCLDDSTLYCYRTFAAQTKSAGFVMEFRWTHIF
jgi:hypothetical protein